MKARWRIGAIVVAVLLVAALAYRLGQRSGGDGAREAGGAPVAGAAQETKAPKGWTTHEDPAGFAVQIPRGWRASRDASSGRIEIAGDHDESVLVWPLFVPTKLEAASAPAVLQAMAAKMVPGAAWEPAAVSGASARAHGRAGDREAVAILTWATSEKGSALFAYVTSAPAARYRDAEEAFARVLASVRVTGAPSEGKREAGPSFVKWEDPREHAFSLEVPAGWSVQGGLFREIGRAHV